jgi:alpha-beta hydrolase superfamily lysophospholipase
MTGGKRRNWLRGLGYGLAVVAGLIAVLWAVFATPDIPVATLKAKYASAASQFVEVSPGTTIHVRDEGPRAGAVVVLVHGSNASLHTWEPWVQRLTAKGYRVVSRHRRKAGKQARPHPLRSGRQFDGWRCGLALCRGASGATDGADPG